MVCCKAVTFFFVCRYASLFSLLHIIILVSGDVFGRLYVFYCSKRRYTYMFFSKRLINPLAAAGTGDPHCILQSWSLFSAVSCHTAIPALNWDPALPRDSAVHQHYAGLARSWQAILTALNWVNALKGCRTNAGPRL